MANRRFFGHMSKSGRRLLGANYSPLTKVLAVQPPDGIGHLRPDPKIWTTHEYSTEGDSVKGKFFWLEDWQLFNSALPQSSVWSCWRA